MKVKSFGIINISELKEHEEIIREYLEELKKEIKSDNILKIAIAVDRKTKIILDGHHRLQALKELGYTKIPVSFFEYSDSKLVVISRRPDIKVTKKLIIETVLKGKKFPAKTSKHMVEVSGKLEPLVVIEKIVNIPLEELK